MIGERRLTTLQDLAGGARRAQTEQRAVRRDRAQLARNPEDLPFSLAYLRDAEGRARPSRLAAGRPALARSSRRGVGRRPGVVELERREIAVDGRAGPADRRLAQPPRVAIALPIAAGARRPPRLLRRGPEPVPPARRGLPRVPRARRRADRLEPRERPRARGRAPAGRGAGRARPREDRLLLERQPRVPHAALADPRPGRGRAATAGRRRRAGERLTVVFRNALRLQKLVNNLLEFSRIEAGRAEPLREPTDLARLHRGPREHVPLGHRARRARAGGRAPGRPRDRRVDREMWERIVLNLVSNAFKFTFEGEIRVTLRRTDGAATPCCGPRHRHGHRRRASCRGCSSASGACAARARARTRAAASGSRSCRSSSRLHGGSVEATSEVGAGSTFTVRDPARGRRARRGARRRPRAAPRPTSRRRCAGCRTPSRRSASWRRSAPGSRPARPGRGGGRGSSSPTTTRTCASTSQRLLARYWDVETVGDGRAALEAVAARRPDLILSDAMMPQLDGFGLLNALRADPSTAQLPVIMLSARAGEEAAVEGLSAGADDYLLKPFSSRELIARVRANLDLSELRQAAARATARHAQLLRDLADAAVARQPRRERRRGARGRGRACPRARRRRLGDRPHLRSAGAGAPRRARSPASSPATSSSSARPAGCSASCCCRRTRAPAASRRRRCSPSSARSTRDPARERDALRARAPRRRDAAAQPAARVAAGAARRGAVARSTSRARRRRASAATGTTRSASASGTAALVIGDVVGRGVKAASAMGQLRNATRAYLLEGYGPAATLTASTGCSRRWAAASRPCSAPSSTSSPATSATRARGIRRR